MTKPSTEITLSVAWGSLRAKVWGPENGKPVLALHGWLDNAATFDRLAPLLSPELRIVSVDLPGHGLSDHRPPGAPYHFVDFTVDMFAVLDALGWTRCGLLAHSLGGAIASVVAGVWPERVERVALIEALGPLAAPASELPTRLGLYLNEVRRLSEKQLPVYQTVEEAASARMKVGGISAEAAKALAARGTKAAPGGFTWRSDPRLRLTSPHRLTEEQVMACLEKIACPALLVRGLSGLPLEEALWQRRSGAIKNLRIESRPGGHHLHLDTPEAVAPAISSFLMEHP